MDGQFIASKLDAMRERGGFFWHPSNRSAWPMETKQFIFLANAVNILGCALFPKEWSGEEPRDWTAPILDGSRPYGTTGADSIYAVEILRANRPDLAISQISHGSAYKRPLQDTDWLIAEDIYLKEIAAIVRPVKQSNDERYPCNCRGCCQQRISDCDPPLQ